MIRRWLRGIIREEIDAALKDRKDNIKVRIHADRIRDIARAEIDKAFAAFSEAVEKPAKKSK